MTEQTAESSLWTSHTIVALGRGTPLRHVAVGLALACVATAGINGVWSLTGSDSTLIGGWLESAAPLTVWMGVVVVVLVGIGVKDGFSPSGPKSATGVVAVLFLAYFLGNAASEWLRVTLPVPPSTLLSHPLDAGAWFLQRSFFFLGGVPLLLAYMWMRKPTDWPALRWGRWSVETRVLIPGRPLRSWRWHFWAWVLFPILPFTLFIHSQIDFVHLTSGRLLIFLVPVVGMCLFNALSEELIFRGLLFPALADVWGWKAALWVQAIVFGLLHFGSSPAPLGAVAVFFATAFLATLWGKSLHETGGLGWAVVTHALADFTFFSAQYIAIPG